MTTETTYRALQAELAAIEKATGLYFADESVDHENVEMDENAPGYWAAMVDAAQSAAGQRAEAAGLDINALIGRAIY
jgi:hypothetical protein